MNQTATETATENNRQVKCACGCGEWFTPNPKRSNHKYIAGHRKRAYFRREERKLRKKIRAQVRRKLVRELQAPSTVLRTGKHAH